MSILEKKIATQATHKLVPSFSFHWFSEINCNIEDKNSKYQSFFRVTFINYHRQFDWQLIHRSSDFIHTPLYILASPYLWLLFWGLLSSVFISNVHIVSQVESYMYECLKGTNYSFSVLYFPKFKLFRDHYFSIGSSFGRINSLNFIATLATLTRAAMVAPFFYRAMMIQ